MPHSTAADSTTRNLPPPVLHLGAGDFISTAEVAEVLACTTRTVTRLIQRGHLPAARLGPGRTAYRVPLDALKAFITRHGHHEPSVVADSMSPDELPDFTPEPVLLTTRRTPDGLLLVTPTNP